MSFDPGAVDLLPSRRPARPNASRSSPLFCIVGLIAALALSMPSIALPAHAQDTHAQDTHAQDTHAQDTHAQDTHAQDTHAPETHASETHASETHAQDAPKPRIPDLFDPNHRYVLPEGAPIKSVRFLTTDDFPPFHFALPDGSLAGFDIDLARAICSDLQLACTIQARRFDTLISQIKEGKDDALIAAVANTPATRADLDFTAPYYTTPARFVAARPSKLGKMTPDALEGVKIGVEVGTAHQAYLRTFFPKAALTLYKDQTALHAGLKKGEVDAIFGDGVSLALWLNSEDSKGCCQFRGGPFTESRFFGNGVSIAVAQGNVALRQTLDYELAKLTKNGTYADLYLKYFPIGFY